MYDVLLVAHRIVASDCSWCSFTSVGGASHGTNHLHGIHTLKGKCYYRRSLHRGSQRGEERTIHEVGIMLAQNLIRKLHHLHTCHAQSATLKTVHNLTYQLTLDTAGFQ